MGCARGGEFKWQKVIFGIGVGKVTMNTQKRRNLHITVRVREPPPSGFGSVRFSDLGSQSRIHDSHLEAIPAFLELIIRFPVIC